MPQAQLIVNKCGGIPELIVAIGNHSLMPSTYVMNSLNVDFMGKLVTDPKFHRLRDLFSWMHSYFDACSDSLKPCIFYLSVFSADHNIRRKRLLRRWVAEGYSRDTFNSTAEENGDRLISELVGLSIIQFSKYPGSMMRQCQINGFFHEYIISRPMEDNLVFALEGRCSLNSQRGGQHLTIRRNWDRDMNVFENIDFSRLRSLTVFGEWRPFFISTNTKMRLIRVLDLEDTSGVKDDDLNQIGKVLPRLKFLSLRGCREVSRLPNSIGDLRQLQTLDIRNTTIATLPQAIIKLQRLQYIRAGRTEPFDEGGTVTSLLAVDVDMTPAIAEEHGEPEATATTLVDAGDGMNPSQPAAATEGMFHTSTTSRSMAQTFLSSWLSKFCQRRGLDNGGVFLPAGFGRLIALHTLGVINVSGGGGKAILKELKKLTQLRKLGLCGVNQENWKEFCSLISSHSHLESLSVHVNEDKEQGFFCCFDDISQPPMTLKSLKLHGHVRMLPGWIKHLRNLKKFDLDMTIFTQEDIHLFHDLGWHSVRRLVVRPIQVGELHFSILSADDYSILNFEVLEIYCTSRLHVTFGASMVSSLGLLLVHCSSGSSFKISGLSGLENLEEVWLKGSYSNTLKKDLQQQLSEHPRKPVLKLARQHSS
jgi:Leucine-rich repeat (LRR) protein